MYFVANDFFLCKLGVVDCLVSLFEVPLGIEDNILVAFVLFDYIIKVFSGILDKAIVNINAIDLFGEESHRDFDV